MKTLKLILFLLCLAVRLSAQDEPKITSFYLAGNDATASTKPVLAANKKACALLRVYVTGRCKFEGDICQTKEDIGEYLVYMVPGARQITIKAEGCTPIDVNFGDLEEDLYRLESKTTYILKLAVPSASGRPEVALDMKVLKNGIKSENISSDFRSNDQLYVKFVSPVDGYIAVYLQNDEVMERLLPSKDSKTNAVFKVNANEEYYLFSPKHDKTFDEIVLDTSNPDKEIDELCLVFSTNEFRIPDDNQKNRSDDFRHNLNYNNYPNDMPVNRFLNWLQRQQASDKNMQVAKELITITRR